MLTAAGHVETERASRHLVQLCRHVSHMVERPLHGASGHGPGHRAPGHGSGHGRPEMRNIEWSDTYAVVSFGWGRCTLQATPRALELRAEAADERGLRQLQEAVSRRLETIGSRDHLKVTWEAPLVLASARVTGAATDPEPTEEAARRRGPFRTALLVTAGALALISHLVAGPAVLIGAALGAVGLAGPSRGFPGEALSLGVTFVVLLVLLKILGVAVNVFILGRIGGQFGLGRRAVRRLPPGAARVLRWVIG